MPRKHGKIHDDEIPISGKGVLSNADIKRIGRDLAFLLPGLDLEQYADHAAECTVIVTCDARKIDRSFKAWIKNAVNKLLSGDEPKPRQTTRLDLQLLVPWAIAKKVQEYLASPNGVKSTRSACDVRRYVPYWLAAVSWHRAPHYTAWSMGAILRSYNPDEVYDLVNFAMSPETQDAKRCDLFRTNIEEAVQSLGSLRFDRPTIPEDIDKIDQSIQKIYGWYYAKWGSEVDFIINKRIEDIFDTERYEKLDNIDNINFHLPNKLWKVPRYIDSSLAYEQRLLLTLAFDRVSDHAFSEGWIKRDKPKTCEETILIPRISSEATPPYEKEEKMSFSDEWAQKVVEKYYEKLGRLRKKNDRNFRNRLCVLRNGVPIEYGKEYFFDGGIDILRVIKDGDDSVTLGYITSLDSGLNHGELNNRRKFENLVFDFRDSDDHGGKYFSVFCLPPKASVLSRRNLFRSFCFAFATTALVGAGTYSGYQLAFSRYEAASKHLYSDPFGVTAQASGDSVALDIYALPHVIKTIEIDWGDQSEPESVDLAFDEDSYDIPVRVEVPHTYAGVASPVGVRGELKVQFILRRPPDILPEPLTDENRLVTHEMLRLPYGIILDPPAERLDVFAPTGDTTVLSSLELSFADSGFTEPIHFVGRAISSSDAIWLGNADPQLPGIADPRTFAIKIPFEEPFRLSLVSGPAKVAQMDGRTLADYARRHVLWSTSAAPPGAILSPSEGAQVDSLGTVQLLSFGQDFSATVAIRPQAVDVFWVQNDPRVLEGSDPQSITVHYGGTFGDSYEVWAGFSTGVVALSTGDQIARLPQTDAAGGRIWWVGPIIVDHQE